MLGTVGSYTPRGTGSALNSKLRSSLSRLAELDRDSGRVLESQRVRRMSGRRGRAREKGRGGDGTCS